MTSMWYETWWDVITEIKVEWLGYCYICFDDAIVVIIVFDSLAHPCFLCVYCDGRMRCVLYGSIQECWSRWYEIDDTRGCALGELKHSSEFYKEISL